MTLLLVMVQVFKLHILVLSLSHFTLNNVLCVPSKNQNLISISKFYRSNKTSIELFPSYFLIKDLCIGKPLLQGKNMHDLYKWPHASTSNNSSALALATTISTKASSDIWHRRLGHPSFKIMKSFSYLWSSFLFFI